MPEEPVASFFTVGSVGSWFHGTLVTTLSDIAGPITQATALSDINKPQVTQ
jgi:hypothetical protein